MLSEEEKQAINNLYFIVVTDIYDNEVSINKTEIVNEYNHSVGTVLNLITKLQKENEKLNLMIAKSTAQRVLTDIKHSKKSNEDLEMLAKGYDIEIQKLQKENEEKDQEITKYKNMYKSEHDIHNTRNEQLDRKERGIIKVKQQLIEKDKQIDLMAEYISKHDTNEDICEEQAPLGCDDIDRDVDCKLCIKQYFEKLAKENKQ